MRHSAYNPYNRVSGPKGCKGKNSIGESCNNPVEKGGFCKKCSPIFSRRRSAKLRNITIWTK